MKRWGYKTTYLCHKIISDFCRRSDCKWTQPVPLKTRAISAGISSVFTTGFTHSAETASVYLPVIINKAFRCVSNLFILTQWMAMVKLWSWLKCAKSCRDRYNLRHWAPFTQHPYLLTCKLRPRLAPTTLPSNHPNNNDNNSFTMHFHDQDDLSEIFPESIWMQRFGVWGFTVIKTSLPATTQLGVNSCAQSAISAAMSREPSYCRKHRG